MEQAGHVPCEGKLGEVFFAEVEQNAREPKQNRRKATVFERERLVDFRGIPVDLCVWVVLEAKQRLCAPEIGFEGLE